MQQSFSFGQTQPQVQSTFGSGGTTGTGFGGFGGGFSQPTSQPSFGTSFAAPATSTAPAFGTGTSFGGFGGTSTFGTPPTGTATAFGAPQTGTAFGTPQLSSTSFGGQQSGTTTFGTTTQPAATGFGTSTGVFGTGQPGSLFSSAQPATSSAFGTGQTGFGTQPTSGFGSGLGTSTFGATTQPSLFGTTQPATGFGQPQTSTFGATQSGSWLGAGQQQQSTFTGFGGATGGSLFGQQQKPGGFSFGQPQQPSLFSLPTQQLQQQPQQQVMVDEQAAFHQSIFSCCRFGDERDAILANLNFIQSCWGTGKGYYNQSHPPVLFNDKNVFYRFKAVGYSCMYTDSNEDGQVVIQIKKPHTKVRSEESTFINTLQNMIAKPNIFFKITGSKAVNEEMTVIILTADDRQSLRRVLATDLAAALVQPQLKPQLDNLGIVDVCAKVKPSPEQLKAYLENPPAGVDPRVWKKAQEDNPDPANMIPFPLIGPAALKQRLDVQVKESQQHQERLKLISDEVANLTNRHANISAELVQMRRRCTVMSHRIISVVVRLQMLQRQDIPLQQEEEALKKQLEILEKEINSPKHFRGRLNELMSNIRLHKTELDARGHSKYTLDSSTSEQVKEFLNMQQDSIKHLVDTLRSDIDYVQRMEDTVSQFNTKGMSS